MRLPDELIEQVAGRLKVLADASRLRLLNGLRHGERSVQDLADEVGLSQPNASRHLAVLLRTGMVVKRQNGKQCFYRVVDPFIDRICDSICGSLAAHVERQMTATVGSAPTDRARSGERRS